MNRVVPEPALADAAARLVFRDAAGSITHSRLVPRPLVCPRGGDCFEDEHITIEIAAQPDAVVAQLYTIDAAGTSLALRASRARSPSPPEPRILAPTPGMTLEDGKTLIEWSGSDPDGDSLKYALLYRPSVGRLRQVSLAFWTNATQWPWERGSLPADTGAVIAVLANDGFNTVETSVGPLTVEGNMAPELWISTPRDRDWFGQRSIVTLIANASDPEDGALGVNWTSDVDGDLPAPNWWTGRPGWHTLTATTHDSDGLAASKQVVIYIGKGPPNWRYLPAVGLSR
jgi:hypothetical protein